MEVLLQTSLELARCVMYTLIYAYRHQKRTHKQGKNYGLTKHTLLFFS